MDKIVLCIATAALSLMIGFVAGSLLTKPERDKIDTVEQARLEAVKQCDALNKEKVVLENRLATLEAENTPPVNETNSPPEPTVVPPKQTDFELNKAKSWAWVMAQKFIKLQLKSPSTADFGGIFTEHQSSDDCVTYLGDNTYQVEGWVDSQNSFGATVRTDFSIKIKYVGNDQWSMLEEPVLIQR